ncbi:methylated-DNA--[protein]-cysteine S-methyltransferase [Myroides pelagicus]|uniref:methylated-DNA--[protein]-cysteine S-methyltransferase n=1 Tax=Myroides pelagicus TaxID=270914 RepID=A0A7K1GM60_9FLAO|nr:methylated-DNA--[protein]-cysteine S-methyltransferase [Myroides pelagicus]MTH29926.1 methylated-DNA--[protein]-cysteine S-methyltransferase [Myroides pelagicus]
MEEEIINLEQIETPIGTVVVCASAQGICLLEFADLADLDKELQRLTQAKQAVIVQRDHPYIQQLKQELEAYFSGRLTDFSVPLDLIGTDFQQKVWRGLLSIPYGEIRSYKQQSDYLDIPKSIRAVANANGMNSIAILIPCHRIIGTDGSLTGYRGGLWRKEFLLTLENKEFNQKDQLQLRFE